MFWSIIPAEVAFEGFGEQGAEMTAQAASPEACRSFNPKYFLRK